MADACRPKTHKLSRKGPRCASFPRGRRTMLHTFLYMSEKGEQQLEVLTAWTDGREGTMLVASCTCNPDVPNAFLPRAGPDDPFVFGEFSAGSWLEEYNVLVTGEEEILA